MKLKEQLILKLIKHGKEIIVRGMKTKEICDYSFKITKFDYSLSNTEKKYVDRKLKKYEKEIDKALLKIIKDTNTRQSVIQFSIDGNKPECINQIQILKRNRELIVILTSRSMDVTKVYQDIEIGKKIAEILEIELNYIRCNIGSLHLYLK